MTIEVVFISMALIWGGVELAKHVLPSWYDRQIGNASKITHERIEELEKKIEELTGAAK